MNVSAPFIVRPIATTLLVVAVVLVGLLGYRQLSVAALPTVEFPTIQVSDLLARRLAGRHAELDFGPARTFPGPHLRPDADEFVELVRHEARSRCNSSYRKASRRRRSTCRRRSTAATGWLPVNDLPFPPIYHQVQPGRHAGPGHRADLGHDAALRRHRICGDGAHSPIGRGRRRRRGHARGCRGARRAACKSILANCPRSGCRSRTFAAPSKPPPSICPRGKSTGHGRRSRSAPTINCSPRRIIAMRSLPIATARRSSSPISARPSTDSRTKSWRPGTTASRRSSSTSNANPAPTSSRWLTRSRSCCRQFEKIGAARTFDRHRRRPHHHYPHRRIRRSAARSRSRWGWSFSSSSFSCGNSGRRSFPASPCRRR